MYVLEAIIKPLRVATYQRMKSCMHVAEIINGKMREAAVGKKNMGRQAVSVGFGHECTYMRR